MGSTAHLLIHTEFDLGMSRIPFASTLRRLRSSYSDGVRYEDHASISLQIDDIWGHRVFATDAAGRLMRVLLPAGTYQVTAHRGGVRRRYTMTLEEGVSFDLHLRLGPDRQS